MKTKTVALAFTVLALSALAGCEFYFADRGGSGGNDGYTYCNETGCWYCDDYGCYPAEDGQPITCARNSDCMAGCFCNRRGLCEETDTCSSDQDCPERFVCDSRNTCVPEGSKGGGLSCADDDACEVGSYCDTETNQCSPSGTCTSDADCQGGFSCDGARGTCVPCGDSDTGGAGACYAEITCDVVAPACPLGTVAGVLHGCYTGFCIPVAQCPDEPPFACAEAADEAECLSHGCEPVYVGIDCTDGNGGSCSAGSVDCTCKQFEYGFCRDFVAQGA
jgi:hypothetical protein